MKKEIAVIALLVALALCIPAWLLWDGMADARARAWRERPYDGTLQEFQAEHIGLLNEAVAVFAAHPEFFEQYFDWSGDATATIYRYDIWHGQVRHAMLSDAEWETVQQLFAEQRCTGVYYQAGVYSPAYGWMDIPSFTFYVNTAGAWGKLLWLPEQQKPDAAAQALQVWGKDHRIEKTAYPNWYAVWLID